MSQEDFQKKLDTIKRGDKPAFTGHTLSQEQVDEIEQVILDTFQDRCSQQIPVILDRTLLPSESIQEEIETYIRENDDEYIEYVKTRLKPNRVVGCSAKTWFDKPIDCGT